jgi:dTMP kinase
VSTKPGLLVTFEGVEGCGKSTLLSALAARLQALGYELEVSREPGGTEAGERIRDVVLDARHAQLSALSELFLMLAARAQLVSEVLRPALARGEIVLCDRYGDASCAYQGKGRGLGIERVEELNQLATGGLVPDLTFLLDLSPAEGRARMGDRQRDRMEREEAEFHERVRAGYLELAERHPTRFKVLDGMLSREALEAEAWTHLEERLPKLPD